MDDLKLMEMCLDLAMEAFEKDEVPVGALIVSEEGEILGRAHNETIKMLKPFAHAEILAIWRAAERMGNFRLNGCTLYVTKEPCIMCAGAIIEARIKRVVFGCGDPKRGAFGSLIDICKLPLNHKPEVLRGLLEDRAQEILRRFFRLRRGTEVAITGPTRNRLYA